MAPRDSSSFNERDIGVDGSMRRVEFEQRVCGSERIATRIERIDLGGARAPFARAKGGFLKPPLRKPRATSPSGSSQKMFVRARGAVEHSRREERSVQFVQSVRVRIPKQLKWQL